VPSLGHQGNHLIDSRALCFFTFREYQSSTYPELCFLFTSRYYRRRTQPFREIVQDLRSIIKANALKPCNTSVNLQLTSFTPHPNLGVLVRSAFFYIIWLYSWAQRKFQIIVHLTQL